MLPNRSYMREPLALASLRSTRAYTPPKAGLPISPWARGLTHPCARAVRRELRRDQMLETWQSSLDAEARCADQA